MYTAGQIIDKKEHIAFANWNNANGGKLRSVSLGDGTYRLEEIPAPTTDELAQEKRAERDALLAQTDKFVLSDYPITEEKLAQYKAYRQYLRDLPEKAEFPNVDVLSFVDWTNSRGNENNNIESW